MTSLNSTINLRTADSGELLIEVEGASSDHVVGEITGNQGSVNDDDWAAVNEPIAVDKQTCTWRRFFWPALNDLYSHSRPFKPSQGAISIQTHFYQSGGRQQV